MKDITAGERRIGFEPIVPPGATILILGSYPSLRSVEEGFYYAHPRNQFWPLLGEVFGERATTSAERRSLLQRHGIALWDTCHSCVRAQGNSSDSNLAQIEPNDIPGLLKSHPDIRKICFTGKKAEAIYRRHFAELSIRTLLLPSPSPAYQAMRYEAKKAIYKRALLG